MTERLGERIRRVRTARGLGLRETATKVGISATYLSRIETNEEKTPPAEKVIRAIAELLEDNFDELMSLAGRIPEDLTNYIATTPGMPAFLRRVKEERLTSKDLEKRLDEKTKGKK